MKLLRLALSRVGSYFVNNRLVAIVFILGSVISSLVFLFFYGGVTTDQTAERSNYEGYRVFLLQWEESGETITEDAVHVLDPWGVQEVLLRAKGVKLNPEDQEKNPSFPTADVFSSLNYSYGMEGIPHFSPEHLSERYAIIPPAYGTDRTEITLDGINFTIEAFGPSHSQSSFYVPIKAFLECFQASGITFMLEQIPSEKEIAEIEKVLRSTFPTAQIVTPEYHRELNKKTDMYALLKVILLYVIALVSFLFLFQYLLDQASFENVIYLLVGATKWRVFFVMFFEIVMLSAVSSVIAAIIHITLYPGLFSKLILDSNIRYTSTDYFRVGIITTLTSSILSLPFIINSFSHTIVWLKNRYSK